MTEVITVPYGQIDPYIKEQLRVLNCGPQRGRMLGTLTLADANSYERKDLQIFYIADEKSNVISWGIVFNQWMGDPEREDDYELCIDVFTVPEHRKKGYGFLIAKAAREFYPTETVYAAIEWTTIYQRAGFHTSSNILHENEAIPTYSN